MLGQNNVWGNDNMKDYVLSKKNRLLLILVLIVVIIFIVYRILSNNNDKHDIKIVESSSKFYTVSNCVSRYINYLNSEDVDNILLLLDNSYKKKNNISSNNLFSKIFKLDNYYSFEARLMYQEDVKDYIIKYYVKGYLIKEDMDFSNDKIDYYLIVILDSKNSTYSIIPYNEELFNKEVLNGK